MIEKIFGFLSSIFLTLSGLYVWSKLLNKKINFKNYKTYLYILIISFISIINYNNVNQLIKFALITFIIALFIKFMYKTSIKEGIITATFSQLLYVFSELIYSIILIFILKVEFDMNTYSNLLLSIANISVSILSMIVVNFKFLNKIYLFVMKAVNKLTLKKILIFSLPIIFVINAYLATTYYKINSLLLIIINNSSIYLIVTILLVLIKKENAYLKIYEKYNTTLNSLKEYENILNKYRMFNHESKNQLMTIRNMISDENIEVKNYIDKIAENKILDNSKILFKVSIVPEGGLRGLIYSKLLLMNDKKIKYNLNISPEVSTIDFIEKIDDVDMLDICQVIGVYLDNAIDEVLQLKRKNIEIKMYIEDSFLSIEISNNYKNTIDIDKLDQDGYTTKGSGRGYGLGLTKHIITNNKKLQNQKKLSKEIFTQILKIKL